jgi:hypothetical protein
MKVRTPGSAHKFLGLALLLSASSGHAAPFPATASSKLIAPELGIFHSASGFQISAGDSGWVHAEVSANNEFIETLYRAPELEPAVAEALAGSKSKPKTKGAETASLTVRVDKLDKDLSLERYVQRWLKEYPRYGFDVLSSRAFTHIPTDRPQAKVRAHVLDLVNRDIGRQLRQVIFLERKRAVILTCRDEITTFQESLKGCNQIIRTFSWSE